MARRGRGSFPATGLEIVLMRNHCGRGDCENFVLDFHDLPPFFLVSNQSWALKGDISNIDWRWV